MVSHAGTALLRELAEGTGLVSAVTGALIGTYRGVPVHMPGRVFADLAVAIADGVDAVTGIEVLRDRGYPLKHPLVLLILDHLRLAHHGLLRS